MYLFPTRVAQKRWGLPESVNINTEGGLAEVNRKIALTNIKLLLPATLCVQVGAIGTIWFLSLWMATASGLLMQEEKSSAITNK